MNIFTRIDSFLKAQSRLAPLFLRIGLATVFLYAAISSFLSPNDWIGYLPTFIKDIFPATVLLNIFSVIELLLAAWLLSGVLTRYAALVCVVMLAGIVASNVTLLPISFRDIGLIFAALALALWPGQE